MYLDLTEEMADASNASGYRQHTMRVPIDWNVRGSEPEDDAP